MKIFILSTKLFAEKATIEQTIEHLRSDHEIVQFDTQRDGLTDENWDNAVQQIVAADRVITI